VICVTLHELITEIVLLADITSTDIEHIVLGLEVPRELMIHMQV
jgi:hypothetical protein